MELPTRANGMDAASEAVSCEFWLTFYVEILRAKKLAEDDRVLRTFLILLVLTGDCALETGN
jgi:hypothetical protein